MTIAADRTHAERIPAPTYPTHRSPRLQDAFPSISGTAIPHPDHTSHTATAWRSANSRFSHVGRNSCATYPVYPESATARRIAG